MGTHACVDVRGQLCSICSLFALLLGFLESSSGMGCASACTQLTVSLVQQIFLVCVLNQDLFQVQAGFKVILFWLQPLKV